ncbi:Transposable element Tcb1 transposase [Araneus ventricosus]|uniref:Transposable element Tcb1 transposase n=1 Tax=Araneus ventricosus TaxID=182803 RepID=A0A4Y2M9J0_ARAVE|nr:Transposable element Tcb1 transposase [Araneus ventricosus]
MINSFIAMGELDPSSEDDETELVGRSHTRVQKIIGKFKIDRLIENESGRGRKCILSDVAKRKILKEIKIDPKVSVVKHAAEISQIIGRSISAETLRNAIRKAGHKSRVARKKPFISLQNQKKRLEFAKTHQLKTNNFIPKIIFSDESKFNIFGNDGRRTVWRKPIPLWIQKNLRPAVQQGGGSVMVWGCMASTGVGNLVFIDGIMNHMVYLDILHNNLTESAKNSSLDGNFIFQHDKDRKRATIILDKVSAEKVAYGSMARNKDISVDVRNLVINHRKNGKSVRIGQILKLSNSTVFNIIRRFKKTNSVENKQRSGRPRTFSEREERWIVRHVHINPRTSAVKLTEM